MTDTYTPIAALPNQQPQPLALGGSLWWRSLRLLPGLAHCQVADLQAMAASASWLQLGAQHSLPHVLDVRRWYLLVQGQLFVRYFGTPGREFVLAELSAGQWCSGGRSEGAKLSQAMEVQTLTPCLVAYWSDEGMQALLRRQPALVWPVLQSVQAISCALLSRLVEMGTLNVRGRVLARLLALADAAQGTGPDAQQVCIAQPPTQMHMAATFGCSREEVGREMARLASQGLVGRKGRSLWLLDVPALRQLACAN